MHEITNDPQPLPTEDVVAIMGCGTMGAGIAQIVAVSGHPVQLFDVRSGAAHAAALEIERQLKKLVAKGSLDAARSDAALARLHPIDSLAAASAARLVIEAIQEDLAVKQSLFASLEAIVDSQAILATNTSSLSITSIAAGRSIPRAPAGFIFSTQRP